MIIPKIKVCGVTTLEDALAIEALGVDFIGFNFIPSSKRYISPIDAKPIIQSLTHSIPVGIFMDQSLEYIEECIEVSGITMAQLHGSESPELCASLSLPVIKVFSVTEGFDPMSIAAYSVPYILFDAQMGNEKGGTGHSFDWSLLNSLSHAAPYFLAGGIGSHNIIDAITHTSAFALDLNSRVENAPGKKSITLLQKCFDLLAQHKNRFIEQ